MSRFASMTERHAFGLEAVAEMTGKLLQAAYQRASHPRDPEDQDRAILLFDRLARGFRLTLTLESRLDRDRRRELAGLDAEAPSAGLPTRAVQARSPRPPREADRERDADLETSDLSDHVADLRRVVADDADILDSDGVHAETLDRWASAWGDVLYSRVPAEDIPHLPADIIAAATPAPSLPARRASG